MSRGTICDLESGSYWGETTVIPMVIFTCYDVQNGRCMEVQVEGTKLSNLKRSIEAAQRQAAKRNKKPVR